MSSSGSNITLPRGMSAAAGFGAASSTSRCGRTSCTTGAAWRARARSLGDGAGADVRSGGRVTSGRAGHGIVRERLSGAVARFAQCPCRALHGKRARHWLYRLGWRPPACHQRGRRPSGFLANDHADGATLGRQGRPRRPELPGGLLTAERAELLARCARDDSRVASGWP
jgi:hypothetical protein